MPHLGRGIETVAREQVAHPVGVKPVLDFQNVSIDYPKRGRIPAFRAADSIDFQIFPGEIVGLVGESGSGKTTLGRAAVGLLPIADGTLISCGIDISHAKMRDLRPLRRKAGIVFQDPASSLNPIQPRQPPSLVKRRVDPSGPSGSRCQLTNQRHDRSNIHRLCRVGSEAGTERSMGGGRMG